jgi:staphylococcal nuclease domain-containing protein 1
LFDGSVGNVKRGEPDEPYAFEAREFLRKKLIGKKVKRVIDYTRPPPADQKDRTPRPFATLTYQGQNISELLVSAGLATVIKHRAEDARASAYDALCVAEAQYVRLLSFLID